MKQSLFLGFDGGATKTRGVALNSDKKILAEEAGEPSNFQIIGIDKASKNIFDVAQLILKRAGADFSDIEVMCLGLAGAGRKDDAEKMCHGIIELFERKNVFVPKVFVESDAIAALEGAFGGKPGMILIGGTGSILFAKEASGDIHRVGGWGRFIGDEGSGYALGRGCLTAIAREFDGRGKKTVMTQLLSKRFNIDSPQSLISEVYQKNFDIASVAPIVIDSAERGDESALDIVTANVDDLVDHVRAMLSKVKTVLPLVLVGSILSADNIYSRNFRQSMGSRIPDVEIRKPEFPPAVGAALLAYKMK